MGMDSTRWHWPRFTLIGAISLLHLLDACQTLMTRIYLRKILDQQTKLEWLICTCNGGPVSPFVSPLSWIHENECVCVTLEGAILHGARISRAKIAHFLVHVKSTAVRALMRTNAKNKHCLVLNCSFSHSSESSLLMVFEIRLKEISSHLKCITSII